MGSPRRVQRDQDKRGDIKDRLQALAKLSSSEGKKTSVSSNERGMLKSQNNTQPGKDKGRNEKISSRKDSMERVMERARTEGGNRWTKRLLDEEAKDPERWGHSGFKELYKNELGMTRNRRSRSHEKSNIRRSKSRDRAQRTESGRTNSNRDRNVGGLRTSARRKRSRSGSDHSPISGVKWRSDVSKRPSNGASDERKSALEKTTKSNSNRVGRVELSNKPSDRRRETAIKKDRILKKRSPVRSHSRSRSPLRHPDKNNTHSKKQVSSNTKTKLSRRGPVSPPERRRSDSGSRSRSTISPTPRRRACLSEDVSSRSTSSRSRSSLSRSSSSSSSSSESSTSSSSKEVSLRRRANVKARSSPSSSRSKQQIKVSKELTKQSSISKNLKRQISTKSATSAKKRRSRSESESSSNGSSSDTEDEDEEGEEDDELDGEEPESSNISKEPKSGNSAPRLSLSERFGKLAQLSSQRRNLELVQLRIVAPVGTTEKNVSIDESSAAPVISNLKSSRERSIEPTVPVVNHHPHHHHHQIKNPHTAEETIRKDERARDDRWRDWHERYDQYRHVQPPRQLPRDWDDIRVRHKYYTERGYFGHDMTLEELSRWEAWWHRYQQWRRGYEHAWIKTHGPHVPIEYPDWSNYRSTHNRGEGVQLGSMSSSIRSRLGWRR